MEGDSKNHLAHFYYAQLLQQLNESTPLEERNPKWDIMRSHLQKTIDLVPRFVHAYSLLGYVALVSREGLADAETALKKGIEYAPGRLELASHAGTINVVEQ